MESICLICEAVYKVMMIIHTSMHDVILIKHICKSMIFHETSMFLKSKYNKGK